MKLMFFGHDFDIFDGFWHQNGSFLMVLNIKSWFFALFSLFESRFWSKSRHFCLFFVQNCSFLMVFDMKLMFFGHDFDIFDGFWHQNGSFLMVLNIKSWFFALFLLFESRFWSKSRHFCLFFVQNCSFLMVFDMKSWFFASILLFWGSVCCFFVIFMLFSIIFMPFWHKKEKLMLLSMKLEGIWTVRGRGAWRRLPTGLIHPNRAVASTFIVCMHAIRGTRVHTKLITHAHVYLYVRLYTYTCTCFVFELQHSCYACYPRNTSAYWITRTRARAFVYLRESMHTRVLYLNFSTRVVRIHVSVHTHNF